MVGVRMSSTNTESVILHVYLEKMVESNRAYIDNSDCTVSACN